jgi:hypothetical protein
VKKKDKRAYLLRGEYVFSRGSIRRATPKVRMSKKDRRRMKQQLVDGIMAELDKPQPDVMDALKALKKEAIFGSAESGNTSGETGADRGSEDGEGTVAEPSVREDQV